jgi:type II secretory pathway pseudopilin PulG
MKHYSPYKVQALMMFPAIGSAVKKFAIAQASVDLARVAGALERYRLAHGQYPETLDALVPQFIEKLPHDIIGGQPLHYRRTDGPPSQGSGAASGKFVLYSIGWNEKDDGGQIAFKKGGSVDREKGDWVWQYPAK